MIKYFKCTNLFGFLFFVSLIFLTVFACACKPSTSQVKAGSEAKKASSENLTEQSKTVDLAEDQKAWRFKGDAQRGVVLQGSGREVVLYDEARARKACLEHEEAQFMITQKNFKPEALYHLKAQLASLAADYASIERFESSMCFGGAHPMNTFEFQTFKLPSTTPLKLSDIFDKAVLTDAFEQDAMLTLLTKYHHKHAAELEPVLAANPELSPCTFEISPPTIDLTSWTFADVSDRGDEVSIAILLSNPVHMCAGQPLRHTLVLPTPEHLKKDLLDAKSQQHLYVDVEPLRP